MHREESQWYPVPAGIVRGLYNALLLGAALLLAAELADAADDGASAPRAELLFARLSPDLIVNLHGGGSHFLMVTAEISSRSPVDIEHVKHHAPAIRHHLLMLMSGTGYRDATTLEGRKALADRALQEVRGVLDAEVGGNQLEAVLFTSYLVE